jgi:hypothetical protein
MSDEVKRDGYIIRDGIVAERVYGFVGELKSNEVLLEEDNLQIGQPYPWPRAARDKLLDASDWTQMADVELSEDKKTQWRVYRKALRDLPAAYPDPFSVTWPTKPA